MNANKREYSPDGLLLHLRPSRLFADCQEWLLT